MVNKSILKSLLLSWALIISACSDRSSNGEAIISFNFEEFIDEKVELLAEQGKGIVKTTVFGETEERIKLTPDSIGWSKELSLFKTLDISKPGLSPFYQNQKTDSLDLIINRYSLKDSSDLETKELVFISDRITGRLICIKGDQSVKNPIYLSARNMSLWFKPDSDGIDQIDSFNVTGYQKIISMDSTLYVSAGKVITP